MPVSASIYDAIGRGVQPVEDPQNALLKALKLQGAQQELQSGAFAMDEKRRGVERGNRLQNLLMRQFATPDERAAAMEGGGFLDEADKYRKSIADRGKVEADTDKTRNEVIGAGLKRYREQLDYIESPQTAARWIQSQYQDPTIGKVMAQFGPVEEALARIPQDPQAFAQWREQQTQGMEKYRASIEQKPTSVDAGGTKKFLDMNPKSPTYKQEISSTTVTESEAQRLMRERQAADAAAGRAVTIRGQNMTDARAREAAKAAGGASGAKTTEGERTAGALLQRLRSSQMQLEDALLAKPDAAKPGLVASGLRAVGQDVAANSLATGEERQQVEAAQLDILDAALTLGTGAAYTREQLEGYRKSYFPQIGDKEKTIADKQIRLKNIIEAAEVKAGNAASQVPTVEQMREKRPGPNPKRDYRKEADAIIRGG